MHSQSFRVLIVIVLLLLLVPGAALAAGDPYEPNDTKSTASPVSFSGSVHATIDPPGDQDFYRFSAQTGEYLFAGIRVSGFVINLYGGNQCSSLMVSTTTGYLEAYLPESGDYCLRVRSANHPTEGGASFHYTLYLQRGDHYEYNDTIATATPIAMGQTIDATLHLTLQDYYVGDPDYFVFTGRKGDHMLARIFTDGFFIVELLGTDGMTVLERSRGFSNESEHLIHSTLPDDGTYFLYLIGFEDSSGIWFGDYTLTLDKGEFVSSAATGSVDNIQFDKNDVLLHYMIADRWELLVDLSDIGITKNLSSFHVLPRGYERFYRTGNILLSIQSAQALFLNNGNVPTVVMPHDIVSVELEQTGGETAGMTLPVFDGSDVGLTTASEKIDGLAVASDGRLLISTVGGGEVPGAGRFKDEDILAFTPTQWGLDTAGTWSLYFDGSTIPGLAREDVTGIDVGLDGDLYLTLQDSFTISGTPCGPTCILTVHPDRTAEVYWDGRDHRFPFRLDGIDLPGGADVLWP